MPERRFPVTFAPSGITVWAEEGTTVLAAARSAGIIIPSPCGGRGVCGKCAVRVVDGSAAPPEELERRGLKLAPPGMRLACLMRVTGPVTVRPMIAQEAASAASADVVTVEDAGLLAAIDLGTTTVGAVVVGAGSGRELGRAFVPNTQASWGSDVLSRLSAAQAGEADSLRAAAEDSIVAALTSACGRAGACLAAVKRLVIAGNTAMASLLLGLDVGGLVQHPFEMPFDGPAPLPTSSRLPGMLAEGAETIVLPPLGSFVGGDVIAGMIAAGLIDDSGPVVYVDAGTNAEMALVTPAGVVFASAAAGPAFEGFGVRSGGVAAAGGVTGARIEDGDVRLDVLGGGTPGWFTGSGLLAVLQMLRAAGHLASDGALTPEGPLQNRFTTVDDVRAIRLGVEAAEDALLFTQMDVRALQTAKAAVSAGILALVRAARVKPRSIQRWIVSGAFGAAVSPQDLVSLGILPTDAEGRVEQIGDATLIGAAMLAVDPDMLDEAIGWLADSQHVPLAEDGAFRDAFIAATALREYSLKKGF